MSYLHTSMPEDIGQLMNDVAELVGIDYGPILGALAAMGLFTIAATRHDQESRTVACSWYRHVCDEARMSPASLLSRIADSI